MNVTKEGHNELLLRSGVTIDLQKKIGTNNSKIGMKWQVGCLERVLQSTWLQNDGSSVLMSASANGNVEIFAARKWCSDRCVLKRRPINCLVCNYTE